MSLLEAACAILSEPDPWKKAELTNLTAGAWRGGDMSVKPQHDEICPMPPDRPARGDDKVKVVAPGQTKKRGKGGSLASRIALIHSLAHIENWATDLAWDVIARFGSDDSYELPREFYDDFVTVAEDECRHFLALEARLKSLGSYYGALTVHDGLWESASKTSSSLAARLAVESCVHEARGLDVLPSTITKFRMNGDEETALLLEEIIYPEEVGHCAAGVRWFRHLYKVAKRKEGSGSSPVWMKEAVQFEEVEHWFHSCVTANFWGSLKPPFNDEARARAGFEPSWYLPLVEKTSRASQEYENEEGCGDIEIR